MEPSLYDGQQIVLDHLMRSVYTPERIKNGTACAVLNLRAGMGKTFLAAGLIAALGLRTLYIVPKRPLLIQAVKDLKIALCDDNRTVDIWAFERPKPPKTANPSIVVIVINSALARPSEFF
jgi:superfamily II DNA or RNA helicase